ncbi:hypothetical protein GCM10009665_12730 [Kitasatospora nipponensis]|uniref:Uncharacterized protein n=1 Tax=Kitasatospora nipponensis TaxID=258049 RepID=A0ABN1VVI3_9ACTN
MEKTLGAFPRSRRARIRPEDVGPPAPVVAALPGGVPGARTAEWERTA